MNELMIDVFNEYVGNYDMNQQKVKMKYDHSFRVMDLSEQLGKILLYDEESLQIIKLIGLYHDIGRFYQIKKYDTFNDLDSIDHAGVSVDILFKENLIRKLLKENTYDEIIKNAVYIHNKQDIPTYIDDKTKEYCKIIRDADKIDIYRVIIEGEPFIIDEYPSSKVWNDFNNHKSINKIDINNTADRLVLFLAFVYDINYKYSFNIIKDNNYIDKLIKKMNYKNDELKTFFEKTNLYINEYINGKTK